MVPKRLSVPLMSLLTLPRCIQITRSDIPTEKAKATQSMPPVHKSKISVRTGKHTAPTRDPTETILVMKISGSPIATSAKNTQKLSTLITPIEVAIPFPPRKPKNTG